MVTWDELFRLQEVARQRREALVALRRAKLARGTEGYAQAASAATLALLEGCPLLWSDMPEAPAARGV